MEDTRKQRDEVGAKLNSQLFLVVSYRLNRDAFCHTEIKTSAVHQFLKTFTFVQRILFRTFTLQI